MFSINITYIMRGSNILIFIIVIYEYYYKYEEKNISY